MKRRAVRGRRLALVIAAGAVTAVELRATWRGLRTGRVGECAVEPPAQDGAWPELEAALAELVKQLGIGGCTADVLLARPLAHVKVAALPPVRRRDLRPLLQRGARRWFPVADGAVAAEVIPLARWRLLRRHARSAAGIPSIALVAPEAVTRGVAAALAGAGLRPGIVAPVSLALAALALRRAGRRALARGFALVARGAGWAERIVLRDGAPRLFQPLPAGGDHAHGIAIEMLGAEDDDAASRPAHSAAVAAEPAAGGRDAGGDGAPRPAASGQQIPDEDDAAPRAAGEPQPRDAAPAPPSASDAQRGDDAPPAPRAPRLRRLRRLEALPAAAAAALGAATCLREQPLLLPASLRDAWTRRMRRRALARGGAAAALLALAAAVHLRGLEAELAAVQAARRAVAPAAAEARKAREAAAAVQAMLGDVRDAERTAPHWAELFARIADALPDSAHLVSFRAQDGELRLGGVAASAAAAAAALSAAGALDGVSLAGPVRADGASGRERFELSATPAPRDGDWRPAAGTAAGAGVPPDARAPAAAPAAPNADARETPPDSAGGAGAAPAQPPDSTRTGSRP